MSDPTDPIELALWLLRKRGVTLADVTPEQGGWLSARRIPLAKEVLVDVDPATNKSTLTLDWAARVSTGASWPDGSPNDLGPAGVLLLSAEDGLADTTCRGCWPPARTPAPSRAARGRADR